MLKHLIWKQTQMKLKQWQNIFNVIVNANSIAQNVIQIKNGIINYVDVNVKIIIIIVLDPSTCICENSKCLKSIADTSLTDCDKIILVIDNVLAKNTNPIARKKTNTIARKRHIL